MENRQATNPLFKVLVVDDHPNTAHMLARAISRIGSHVEVVSATSGPEALHHVEDGAVDILITDMMMPEMTGMQLVESINDMPSITAPVIFLLTAHNSTGVKEIARRLNVKEVIQKPMHPEQICELISQTVEALKQSRASGSTSQDLADKGLTVEAKQEDLDVSQLLWEVAKKFQPQADVKNHLLVVGKTEAGLIVRGNAAQLRQALRGLVWNAIQNTPRGGSVMLSSEIESNKVRISIKDTGYGNNGHDEIEGNGLELAIVKSIIEQHQGQIDVQREPGKGTCFTALLPLASMKISVTEPTAVQK